MTLAHLELGIGNGQAYSHLLRWGMGIKKSKFQLLGLGMGMKNKFPTYMIKNGNNNLIPKILEWEIASNFPRNQECNWEI